MPKKIKLVYDWFGPKGPMTNNHPPSLWQLSNALGDTNSTDTIVDPSISTLIFKAIDGFEYVPSFSINNGDVFFYEMNLHWKQHFDFLFGPGTGILDTSCMAQHIEHAIRYQNGYILIEYVPEAYIRPEQLNAMHNYFAYKQIPLKKIIYMVGSPNASEVYTKWCDTNNIPLDNRMNVIWIDHVSFMIAKRAREGLTQVTYPNGQTFEQIERDFLVLNRRPRQHRSNLLMIWWQLGLIDKSYISCPAVDPDSGLRLWKDGIDPNFANETGLNITHIEQIQSLLPLKFDGIQDPMEMILDYNASMTEWYSKSMISVVTETNFYEDAITVTEKTYKPIRYKHPFILAGVNGGLKSLKNNGYKTFDRFWDESYDQIENPNERIRKIANLCKEISEWPVERKRHLFNESRKIVEHNNNVLFDSYPTNNSMQFFVSFKNKFGSEQKQQRALVCGGAGFIGTHLVSFLKSQGFYVVSADINDPQFGKNDADEFIKCDLRDKSSAEMLLSMKFDHVYQLAADMGGAGFIFTGDNDNDIMHNNTLININILDAVAKHPVDRIFYASSACIYPQHNQLDPSSPVCIESSAYPADPDSEYGWEKLYSERLYLTFARTKNANVRIARLHNVFGPCGTWNNGREKAPAAVCRKIATANGPIDIWGDGNQTRTFLYIDECVKGIYKIMCGDYGEPLNLGSEELVSINKLVEIIAKIADKSIVVNHIDGPTGVRGRKSDNTLIMDKLNWKPNEILEDGLQILYKWIEQQICMQGDTPNG
jgi:GDP-D-mannose 3', 5'-epimerase